MYGLWLLDIWIPRSPQGLRRVSMLKLQRGHRSVKTERVVIYAFVRNIGYITGIGVHVNRCREGAYISAYKVEVTPFPLGMDDSEEKMGTGFP